MQLRKWLTSAKGNQEFGTFSAEKPPKNAWRHLMRRDEVVFTAELLRQCRLSGVAFLSKKMDLRSDPVDPPGEICCPFIGDDSKKPYPRTHGDLAFISHENRDPYT